MKIHESNLAAYANAPGNLPSAVKKTVNFSSDFAAAATDGVRYTNDDADDPAEDDDVPMSFTGFVDPSGNSVTRQQLENALRDHPAGE